MAGWLSNFLLGRPGAEIAFTLNPESIEIVEAPVASVQRNLAGDLRKRVVKASAPTIRISSKRLSPAQRNQISSLARIQDTFLCFKTRDDWEVYQELVTIVDATHLKLANTSSTRLSALLVALGGSSIITIETPFAGGSAGAYTDGEFGAGAYGGAPFDPGAITYDDATRIITMANALSDLEQAIFVSYTYTGWLVNLKQVSARSSGANADIFQYDIELNGA